MSEAYDFIVVGGGTSGLVLASRLSEDPAVEVLVVEAGDDLTADPRVSSPSLWATLTDSSINWELKTIPQDGLGGRFLPFRQGRMLGGSSALNGFVFGGPSRATIDSWYNLGNPGWDWPTFSKSLRKSFTYSTSQENSTDGGPIQATAPADETQWPKVWRQTLNGLGFPSVDNPFSGQICGSFTVPDSIDPNTKERSYSANAYLGPARARPNLHIWTQTMVERICFSRPSEGVRATGVNYQSKTGATKFVAARREVMLTAGTFNSPKILEQSGVGSASRLASCGIDVVVDNPNVGENLQNHMMCTVNFEVREAQAGFETLDGLMRQDPAAIGAAMEIFAKQKSGPLSKSNTNDAGHLPLPGSNTAEGLQRINDFLDQVQRPTSDSSPSSFGSAHAKFVRSLLTSPDEPSAFYLACPAYVGYERDGSVAIAKNTAEYFTIVIILSHPLSRGSVHVESASTSSGLVVDPKYLSHPVDVEVLSRHLQFAESKIAGSKPLSDHLIPSSSSADLEKAKEYLRNSAVGAYHFTGTCAMMPRELGGVVDPQLRVYGCSNLRVCDASIIPITPPSNPQATVYGVAEHAASIIKSDTM
ncbi:hypothetical protein GGR52DRAFT_580135 [Hypoxylon sp. FL1284]|nr:hypothetical protein GGR52DRAFT_580135 [Hypoxylon sp. FL1284]